MGDALRYTQVHVKLDQEDKEAIKKINSILDTSGIAPTLLAGLHIYSWANMDVGLISFAIEDWTSFAKALQNSNTPMLIGLQRIAARQLLRHQLSGTQEQYEFWESYSASISTALRGK